MLQRFIALLAISLVFTLISCNKSGGSDENIDPELLGVWSWTEGDIPTITIWSRASYS